MTSQFSTGEKPYIYGFIIGSKGFINNQVQKVTPYHTCTYWLILTFCSKKHLAT